MAFTKITSADLADKGVIGLPDTPELSTTEMQEKFDEIAIDVLVPAHNTLVDELDSAFEGVEGEIDDVEGDLANKADKATTLAGYGIIDAKIEDGTIRLGNKTLTPATEPFTRYADGLVPKSGSATLYQYLRSDGTWAKPDDRYVSITDITGFDYKYDLLLTSHESGGHVGNALHSTDIYFDAKEKDLHVEKINGVVFDNILPTDKTSGNPAVITDAFGGACKSLKLTLEPIQSGSGTPSPQNVRPISGRSSATIDRYGKNLLPFSRSGSTTINGITFTVNSDGTITVNGTATATATFLVQWGDPLSPMIGESIILNGCPAVSGMRLQWYNSDGQGNAKVDTGSGTGAFTPATVTNANVAILVFNGYTINNQIVKPMVRPAEISDGTYEPYETPETLTRSYGQTVYGGTDDVTGEGATSEWTLITPTVTSVAYSASAQSNYALCNVSGLQLDADAISNMYAYTKTSVTASEGTFIAFAGTFAIYDNDFTTKEIAQAKLNDCRICYKLATPTSIPLTAQNITLLHGDNVLTTDADNIEASYSADIALYIAKKIAEGSNNRNLSKGGGGSDEPEVKEEKLEKGVSEK